MENDDLDLEQTFFESDKDIRILTFLKGLPSVVFTDTGVQNICKRFDITPDQLQEYINVVNDQLDAI